MGGPASLRSAFHGFVPTAMFADKARESDGGGGAVDRQPGAVSPPHIKFAREKLLHMAKRFKTYRMHWGIATS